MSCTAEDPDLGGYGVFRRPRIGYSPSERARSPSSTRKRELHDRQTGFSDSLFAWNSLAGPCFSPGRRLPRRTRRGPDVFKRLKVRSIGPGSRRARRLPCLRCTRRSAHLLRPPARWAASGSPVTPDTPGSRSSTTKPFRRAARSPWAASEPERDLRRLRRGQHPWQRRRRQRHLQVRGCRQDLEGTSGSRKARLAR